VRGQGASTTLYPAGLGLSTDGSVLALQSSATNLIRQRTLT
jgi:hypothetical protein